MRLTAACLLAALAVPLLLTAADEPKSPSAVLIDTAGKEHKLDKWKFAAGTRKLSWLPGEPEAIAFRELDSTTFKDGILTLVPLDRVKSLAYDYEKKTVALDVAGRDEPLKGFGQFAAINQIAIDAEVDRGELGVAELRFKSGTTKGALKELRLNGKPPADPKDPPKPTTHIHTADAKKDDAPLAVGSLQALYLGEKGAEKLSPTLHFKKTLKLDLAKIGRIKFPANVGAGKEVECDVTFDDSEQTLTLMTTVPGPDGKPTTLQGFIAEMPGIGWKLFPIVTLSEIETGK